MMSPSILIRKQSGLTLVELMIAMVLGLFLLAGVIQIFLASKQSYLLTSNHSLMQENQRFSHYFISQVAESAGHLGCLNDKIDIVNVLNPGNGYDFNFSATIRGYDATGAGWNPTGLPTAITSVALPDSDIVALRGIVDNGVRVRAPYMPTTAAALQVDGNNTLSAGDVVVITDCQDAAIFQVTNKTNGTGTNHALVGNTGAGIPGNATNDLGKIYGAGSEVSALQTISYFVANDTDGTPSLFRRIADNTPEPLIRGVENMQILYGEDTSPIDDRDFSVNQYVTATNVGNWNGVVSIRIGLLLQSEDAVRLEKDTRVYDVLGTTIDPADDKLLRRVFSSTISLRNRLQ